MAKALFIDSTRVEESRRTENYRNERFDVKVVGRNYENKLQPNTEYNVIVVSVPYYANDKLGSYISAYTKYKLENKKGNEIIAWRIETLELRKYLKCAG